MLNKLFLMVVAVAILAGCSSVPAKKDTALAPYTTLVVRPLSFEQTIYVNVENDDKVELANIKTSLLKSFNDEFEKYAMKLGYFEKVVFSDQPQPGALEVYPSITALNGGIRMLAYGIGTAAAKIVDPTTGKALGTVTASRTQNRPAWSTTVGTIEKLMAPLGEDIASGLPTVGKTL
ncbi:hypothetical protein OR1_03599 [Geobacter sp. OR-1]|uniref:hypothetical protein n=1 Tax=Geobacter sp. OR-1 TaxID=1266765 RepID=UPI000542EBC3|nr:hypothetical protein [Geobacter sp. OR-1]GAM11288.1 hypothetical protein OR1_03599 [Geobacter sp. OR-1]